MSPLSPDNKQPDCARSPGQNLSDGRGGSETQGTMTGPRYLYYRMYAEDGAIKSNNSIYANDPFISRTLSKKITPPRTASSVKDYLCWLEGFPKATTCSLFESLSSQTAVEDETRLNIRVHSGLGCSEDDPVIVVVGTQDVGKRSQPKAQSSTLPDGVLREPRYLYYCVYKGREGGTASKTCFDADDDTLGRIDVLSIAPPHIVNSIKRRIVKAEGRINGKIQVFKDIDGEELMNDDDHLSLLAQTYSGSLKDDPIALIVGEPDEDEEVKSQDNQSNAETDTTFNKLIKVTGGWGHDTSLFWLTAISGNIFKTDGVKIIATHSNNSRTYQGYMAINSDGKKGFVPMSEVSFVVP